MKTCKVCDLVKNDADFYKGVKTCKDCYKANIMRQRAEKTDHYKAYDKARAMLPHRVKARKDYAKTDAGKAAGSKAKKAWVDRNAVKRGASAIVTNAVRDDRLAKPDTCEECGNKPSRLHGHHDDYAFTLRVRWLCPGCHTKWHKDNGMGLNG